MLRMPATFTFCACTSSLLPPHPAPLLVLHACPIPPLVCNHHTRLALRVQSEAVANHGPVSIGMDASQDSFQFYQWGIYYDVGPQRQVLLSAWGSVLAWFARTRWTQSVISLKLTRTSPSLLPPSFAAPQGVATGPRTSTTASLPSVTRKTSRSTGGSSRSLRTDHVFAICDALLHCASPSDNVFRFLVSSFSLVLEHFGSHVLSRSLALPYLLGRVINILGGGGPTLGTLGHISEGRGETWAAFWAAIRFRPDFKPDRAVAPHY